MVRLDPYSLFARKGEEGLEATDANVLGRQLFHAARLNGLADDLMSAFGCSDEHRQRIARQLQRISREMVGMLNTKMGDRWWAQFRQRNQSDAAA